MDRKTVEVQVAGQSYRLVTTSPEPELRRLAAVVDAKLESLNVGGRTGQPQSLLLAALALAHDLEVERAQRERQTARSREMMRRVLVRVDDALAFDSLDAG